MKIMFTVQGEGRGHMTQAIAMSEMLHRRGHQVVAVLAGSNQSRSLPEFFERAFDVPVRQIASPGFSLKRGRSISLAGSAASLLRNVPRFRRSLSAIDETLEAARPDLIVNFLEPLTGVYNLLRPHRVPVLVVGHQFMLDHPRFTRQRRFSLERWAMRQYLRLTGARSAKLALSFYSAADLPRQRLFVSPPILRRQLFDLHPDSIGGFLLVYLLNHGYAGEIIRWHQEHSDIPIHCFYDRPGAPEEEQPSPNLTFHRLHGEKFLRLMATCRGVACSAGVESVSEAAYLGKPLLMIPVESHFEQFLNACDAEESGLGMRDAHFRLSRLLGPANEAALARFRSWVGQAEMIAMRTVEATAAARSPRKFHQGPVPLPLAAARKSGCE
jgi:uncharacterized protein (TIGR00661 family)